VQFKSVFGNILKEVYPRIAVFVLLLLVSFQIIEKEKLTLNNSLLNKELMDFKNKYAELQNR
jgi:hypothetical protein